MIYVFHELVKMTLLLELCCLSSQPIKDIVNDMNALIAIKMFCFLLEQTKRT